MKREKVWNKEKVLSTSTHNKARHTHKKIVNNRAEKEYLEK